MRCECIQCGYDLTALVKSVRQEATCPECGHVGPPAPVNFMGLLKSRRRTVGYMLIPMGLASALAIGLRLLGFPGYPLPVFLATPIVLVVGAIVSQTREKSARGRPLVWESLAILIAAWTLSALLGAVTLVFAGVL